MKVKYGEQVIVNVLPGSLIIDSHDEKLMLPGYSKNPDIAEPVTVELSLMDTRKLKAYLKKAQRQAALEDKVKICSLCKGDIPMYETETYYIELCVQDEAGQPTRTLAEICKDCYQKQNQSQS